MERYVLRQNGMGLLFQKKKDRVLSVDIGSLTAKMLVTEGSPSEGLRIMDFRIVHLHQNASRQSPDDIASVLAHTWQSLSFFPGAVRSVVSTRQEVVRVIEMPYASRDELKKSVKYHLNRHVPFAQNETVFDCVSLEKNPVSSGASVETVKCLLVAVRRDILDAHTAIYKAANMVPLLVDVEPVAVMNAYIAMGRHFERDKGIQRQEDEGVALIHIGAHHTDLCVMRGHMPVACRAIEYDMSRAHGHVSSHGGAAPTDSAEQLARVLSPLTTELKASLQYCTRHYNVHLSRVILTGGGAEYESVRAHMEDTLGISAYRFDPFLKADITPLEERISDFRAHASTFTAALGVAVRTVSA